MFLSVNLCTFLCVSLWQKFLKNEKKETSKLSSEGAPYL